MTRNAKYMSNLHKNKIDDEINKILDGIEKEALKGKSHIRLYMGSSDDNITQLSAKINLTSNELNSLGFKVNRDFSVEWRFLIPNLLHEYLDVYW